MNAVHIVTDGYRLNDLRHEILIWANHEISKKRLRYEWMPAALIAAPKPKYSDRDRAKVLFLAKYLWGDPETDWPGDRNLERARAALIEALETRPHEFPKE